MCVCVSRRTFPSPTILIRLLASHLLNRQSSGIQHSREIDIQHRKIRFDKPNLSRIIRNPALLAYSSDYSPSIVSASLPSYRGGGGCFTRVPNILYIRYILTSINIIHAFQVPQHSLESIYLRFPFRCIHAYCHRVLGQSFRYDFCLCKVGICDCDSNPRRSVSR